MPRRNKFRSSQPTINSSLTYLYSSYTNLRQIITHPPNASTTNPVTRNSIHALHTGIKVLLTTLGIDHAVFVQNGLRTEVIWAEDGGAAEMDATDEIHVVGKLLEMVKAVVNEGMPQEMSRGGDAQEDRLQVGSSSKTQRNAHTGVANQCAMNGNEITPADSKTTTAQTQFALTNDVPGSFHMHTSTRCVGDNDHAIFDEFDDVQVPSRPVDEVETEVGPVMINLRTNELAIDPVIAHLAVVEHTPPDNLRSHHVKQEPVVVSDIPNIGEEPNASNMEIDFFPDEAQMFDDANFLQDGVEPVEIINGILGEIGELVDDNNSLLGNDDNGPLPSEPLIVRQDEEVVHIVEKQADNDSEKTMSCCVAGSITNGQECVYGPIFTDVPEEDKIWVCDGEIIRSSKLPKLDDDKCELRR